MTHPLTPREKVARMAAEAFHNGYQSYDQCDETMRMRFDWIADALAGSPALASGSGDHAELARLAEAATKGPWVCKEGSTSYPECDDKDFWSVVLSPAGKEIVTLHERYASKSDDRGDYDFDAAFIAAANPATVLALLAENAALRANEKAALKECSEWARKAGEAIGKLETSEAAGIVEGWRDRATEAERKLAEAVGHMSWMRVFVPTVWDVTEERLSEIDAFLSKEAERG